MTFKGEESNQI